MANQSNLQDLLQQGIDAARRGDKITARRLLTQALTIDRNNEAALMWMASVVETVSERRQYLERVLKVNPNNQRAREAFARLTGSAPPAPGAARPVGGTDADTPRRPAQDISTYVPRLREDRRRQTQRGINPYILAAVAVTGVIIIIVAAALTSGAQQQQQQDTIAATFTAAAQIALAQTATAALSSPDTGGELAPLPPGVTPTPTEFFGIVVTLDPAARTLPPTFTPTPSQTPSITPTPTSTPLPLSSFRVLFTEYADTAAAPDLYTVRADGSDLQPVAGGAAINAAAAASTGNRIAFVRGGGSVSAPLPTAPPIDPAATAEATAQADTPGADVPQLFVGSLDNLGAATAITTLTGSRIGQPTWSPDGTQIAFASNQDGDFDIYVINADGTNLRPITANAILDTTPAWSPDGTRIAFASEADSPGFTEIFVHELATGTTTRLTDNTGSSYAPAWSPDGARIAYLNDGGGDADLFVMDADGQRDFLWTIDDRGAEDRAPAWTPDGRWVIVASNRADGLRFQLYAVQAGGTAVPVVSTLGSVETVALLP